MNESNPTSHKMDPEYGFLSERGIHPENIIRFHILYVWGLFQPTGHPDCRRTSSIFSTEKKFRGTPYGGKVGAAF
jgi:hypothetical protein